MIKKNRAVIILSLLVFYDAKTNSFLTSRLIDRMSVLDLVSLLRANAGQMRSYTRVNLVWSVCLVL